MRLNFEVLLSRFITVTLFMAVMAGSWDAWWHTAIGRDSFWEPPHILLYASVLATIAAGLYGWQQTGNSMWRRLSVLLLLVPLSAPFDEMWHRLFGVESLSSPLIVWSPPHVALVASIIGSFLILLSLLQDDKDRDANRLFGSLAFGGILWLLLFLAAPLQPTGPWHLMGFWGAGVTAAFFAGVILFSQRLMPGIGAASLVTISFLLLTVIEFGERLAPHVDIPPHAHPPLWLIVFSFLIPAIVADMARWKSPWLLGGLIGALRSGVFYSAARAFYEPQFQYTAASALIAIFSALLGGVIAGMFVQEIGPGEVRGISRDE